MVGLCTVAWVRRLLCLVFTLILIVSLVVDGQRATAQRPQVPPAAKDLFVFSHPAMGTTFILYLYCKEETQASEIGEAVFDEVDRIEQLLSNYRETSELSRINREAAKDPVTTDPEMMAFLTASQRWSRASDGAFDITVGRLMRTWGFYHHQGQVPPAAELEQAREVTGWEKVQLDQAHRTVRFTRPGVELDPGGIGKGFAVDAAVRILRENKVVAALISAGSSTLYALHAPPGHKGWRVVVPGPLPSHHALSIVSLRDESLSSADCSQKNFVASGHLYCHIMDPRTVRPVEGRVQVSVIHPSATASDALSNVVFVLPPQQSLRVLETAAPETRALIVSRSKGVTVCSVFRWNVPFSHEHCSASRPEMQH